MKLLKDILYKAGLTEVIGTTNVFITSITQDSRKVTRNCAFVAINGVNVDGNQFIDKAIELGAIAIICEKAPVNINEKINYIIVNDAALALGIIASNFYDNPSSKLKLVGITGTNGKTTTTTLLHQLFSNLGYACGLISTIKYVIGQKEYTSTHTTPDQVRLNELLAQMVAEGCEFCFMEVSSHAVDQKRIAGLDFKVAGFTNITHDHLDYHKTFDAYIKAKKQFFDLLPSDAKAVVNRDDKNGLVMIQNTKAKTFTFGLLNDTDFKAKILENEFSGLHLNIDGHEFWSKLIGGFNAYNLLLVYAVATLLDQDKMAVLTGLSNINAVEGRFQYFRSKSNITAIVDYAHTPDALKNVLTTIENIRTKNENVITVIGCGGDRDAQKRPIMAGIACTMSNKVILTSDNPRSEDPNEIIAQMKKGVEPQDFKKVLSITDRNEAIKTACSLANPGDIILVAGKGHEKYQEIKGEKLPFDDVEVLTQSFKLLEI